MINFKDLGIKDPFIKELNKQGIKSPTQVQSQSIDIVLREQDLIANAPTGTGKTLAFLLPLLSGIIKKKNTLQGLILVPTRELALQITEEAEKINCNKINILTIYGGKDYQSQLKNVNNSIDLIIATPGRLVDFISKGAIKLNSLKTLVLDEVDQILLMGFQKEVEIILSKTSKKRQTLCFSATLPTNVKKMAYRLTTTPLLVSVDGEEVQDNIKKYLVETTDRWKVDALAETLNKTNPFMGIIFCRTKARVDKVEKRLEEKGYNVQKLHSDIPQVKREKIINSFRKAEIQYLVATDVASRGLDITGVTHIFNLDIPEKAETFIHRIGRTARAGEKGEAYLFIDPKNTRILMEIEDHLGESLKKIEYSGERDVRNIHETFKKKYNKKIKSRVKTR